jgi:Phage protein
MEQGRQFKALYASLGFNASEVAKLLHVTPRSVHNWTSGAVPVPFMAVKLLRLMLRYELPGKAWQGWTLSAGKLYTPEGFELAPHEVSWWSLLVRQARQFRSMYRDQSAAKAGPVPGVREPATAQLEPPALRGGKVEQTPLHHRCRRPNSPQTPIAQGRQT